MKKIDISHLSEQIDAWMLQGHSQSKICDLIKEEYNLKITPRSLRRRLYELGVPPLRNPCRDSPDMRARVQALYSEGLRDAQMIEALQKEGLTISSRQLGRLRRNMGLPNRVSGPSAKAMDELVQKKVEEELAADGPAANFTKGQMHAYMRAKYNIVGRDRIQRIVKAINPEAVALRKSGRGRTHTKRPPRDTPTDAANTTTATDAATAGAVPDPQYIPLDPQIQFSGGPYAQAPTQWTAP